MTKLVPVITMLFAVLSIVSGEIEVIVGFVSPTVTEPPKDTKPLIVIDELTSLAFVILPSAILAMFKVP
jgi:hypothetical protein